MNKLKKELDTIDNKMLISEDIIESESEKILDYKVQKSIIITDLIDKIKLLISGKKEMMKKLKKQNTEDVNNLRRDILEIIKRS